MKEKAIVKTKKNKVEEVRDFLIKDGHVSYVLNHQRYNFRYDLTVYHSTGIFDSTSLELLSIQAI